MLIIPAELTTLPQKPQPPADGTPEELLRFAANYGAYGQELENKIIQLQKLANEWSEKYAGHY